MKIELYSAQKLSQKGSSLQKMIQNNDMPILDLLVRESIQNSLDAKDDSSRSKFVKVEFDLGSFDVKKLDRELDVVCLSDNPQWGNRFISISDKNTVGLTGQYKNKESNLYKLVFGIMEAQQASGAGGSWGIGKTVYFRVGVGMVIYYSRVKTDDGYSSLMAAAFVEDETKDSAILPPVNRQKYGIAWWGDKVSAKSSSIKETRKQTTIKRVLDAFGIKPYEGRDTGTVIIIPFIDEAALLKHNQPEREEDDPRPFWMSSVKDYLRIAVQRWYSARLNNSKYPYGKALYVSIDGKAVSPNDMEPFFKLTQQLYNKAALMNENHEESRDIQYADAEFDCIGVRIYSEILPNDAGHVAFAKVNRRLLEMTAPNNRPSPYEYIYSSIDEEDFGKPIFMYCRKPGMVVSYETDGRWLNAVPKSSDDEYIIAWFVLNPHPMMQKVGSVLSLEDYVRKSEMADHSSWEDCAINGIKPTVISKIKKRVASKLSDAFEDVQEEIEKTENTGLSNILGRILLPPNGFGRRPAATPTGEPKTASASHKDMKYKYRILAYTPTGIKLEIQASSGKKSVASMGFSMEMDSVSGPISGAAWGSETGLPLPFFIGSIMMKQIAIDNTSVDDEFPIEMGGSSIYGPMKSKLILSDSGEWYGISFCFVDGDSHAIDISFVLDIRVIRKDIKPLLSFE